MNALFVEYSDDNANVDRLVSYLLDGQLDERQFVQLESELRLRNDAVEAYRDFIMLHGLLMLSQGPERLGLLTSNVSSHAVPGDLEEAISHMVRQTRQNVLEKLGERNILPSPVLPTRSQSWWQAASRSLTARRLAYSMAFAAAAVLLLLAALSSFREPGRGGWPASVAGGNLESIAPPAATVEELVDCEFAVNSNVHRCFPIVSECV